MSEVEEKIYKYQPTDDLGRAIGGLQVIKYKTQDELVQKIQEQNILLIRKLREQTRKNRLGIVEDEELPENIQRVEEQVEFQPRDLSNEEMYEISRDLVDPTKSADAASRLLEAKLGGPLESFGKEFQKLQMDNLVLRAKIEANAFIADNPDYYKCPENFEAITAWMVRYDLAPVKANYQQAYNTLKAQGVIIEGPAIEQVPVEVPVEPVEVKPAENIIQRVPGVSLNRENSSDAGVINPTSDITYTINGITLTGLRAIQAMPADEYKRRLLTDKEFSKKVDKLEAETRKPKA